MLKVFFLVSLVSFLVLAVPNWSQPYNLFESLILSIAYLGWLGPWFLLVMLVLNRLVNVSLRIR